MRWATISNDTQQSPRTRAGKLCAVLLLGLTACAGSAESDQGQDEVPDPSVDLDAPAGQEGSTNDSRARERIEAIQSAVTDWADATSIDDAHTAAEAAANLVVGPGGPGYDDRDGDGVIQGESDTGLLPAVDGEPAGSAAELRSNPCVVRDVLGSTSVDPAAGWTEMQGAIDAWRPDNNTMPSLASHPMRIVGWSTFTLGSDDLDTAHEYAGHAQLHVDVALDALDCT